MLPHKYLKHHSFFCWDSSPHPHPKILWLWTAVTLKPQWLQWWAAQTLEQLLELWWFCRTIENLCLSLSLYIYIYIYIHTLHISWAYFNLFQSNFTMSIYNHVQTLKLIWIIPLAPHWGGPSWVTPWEVDVLGAAPKVARFAVSFSTTENLGWELVEVIGRLLDDREPKRNWWSSC